MRTGKRRIDQLAHIGVSFRNHQLIGIFVDFLHPVDIGAVDFRIDALREHVQRQSHDVDIARPLAIAEQGAFNTVGTGHQAEFRRGDTRSAIIVRMQ